MSLIAQPGITARDLIRVQPVKYVKPSEWENAVPTLVGPPLRAHSEKLPSGRAFIEGKTGLDVNYKLYVDYRRGQKFPFGEKDYIWHPEGSELNEDGSPNLATSLEVQSIVPYKTDGVAQIDAGRVT